MGISPSNGTLIRGPRRQYRHISSPGWILGWEWAKKEVIWNMVGAQATSQGDCSAYHSDPIPHCCAPNPSVVDLLPGVPYNQQVSNCCRGGVISSYAQDPETALSAFQITVGNAGTSNTTVALPVNFTLNTPGPGYSCGPATKVPPSQFHSTDNRRVTQAFMTWNITCTYLQNLAQRAPTCCVSFSTFYSPTITPCAECSCACASNSTLAALRGAAESTNSCIDPNTRYDELPAITTRGGSSASHPDLLYCTRDMCPVKIHWHIKTNYKEYWRVKVTITNRDFSRNFTQWTLTLQHPNFDNFTDAFSFNHRGLNPYGTFSNDTAVFWGVKYFNDILMQAGPSGNVQSELLFAKGKDFKFSHGWAFPHRVYFNGDDCVLPEPQNYPALPSNSPRVPSSFLSLVFIVIGLSLIEFVF
uniref:COBRA-like protein n=1 Tax=Physcomitrium patens TaxID=3218 RepID=A0A7I4AIV8_PHYPA